MGIDVKGQGHGRVAEPFTHDLGMHTGLEGQGGVSVAQVMEADLGQPGTANTSVELPADVLRMQ
jgi:hypothetical protein